MVLSGELYHFTGPGFVYGESEWTFGKHFFSAEVQLDKLPGAAADYNQSHNSSVTIGLLCQSKKQQKLLDEKRKAEAEEAANGGGERRSRA